MNSIKHTALHKKGRVHLAVASLVFLATVTPVRATSNAINISTRMKVEKGDNVLIAGFIINGTGQKKIILRAIGPSLPVPGSLSDPTLELHDASGRLIGYNDNWRSSQQAALINCFSKHWSVRETEHGIRWLVAGSLRRLQRLRSDNSNVVRILLTTNLDDA